MPHSRTRPLETWTTGRNDDPDNPLGIESMADLMSQTHGVLLVQASTPDKHQPIGTWYCGNSDCTVREFHIEFKLFGETAPQKASCPCCGSRAAFHGWRDALSARRVDPPAT